MEIDGALGNAEQTRDLPGRLAAGEQRVTSARGAPAPALPRRDGPGVNNRTERGRNHTGGGPARFATPS